MPQLTGRIPTEPIPNASWPHLKGLSLVDPNFANPGRIDILLGADVYGTLLRGDIRRASSDVPDTSLGWIVSGPTAKGLPSSNAQAARSVCSATVDLTLQESLQQFWLQEEIPSPLNARRSPDERECEAHFLRTFSRDSSGRYTVRLPFRTARSVLSELRSSAALMLQRVRNQMQRDD